MILTTRPFSRIHIDFFFFEHRTYLLMVDSFSKWIEVERMCQGTDCNKVLKKLVAYFARFGLPDIFVSDNGPPFNSRGFVDFLERQGIKVMKSPPYNPASNGQAERLVRTVKEVLKRFLMDPEISELDLEDQINLFLFNFRNNNMTKDGHFPSERIFSYKPKTALDLINPKNHYKKHIDVPHPHDDVNSTQSSGNIPKNKVEDIDNLTTGDEVWYKNHNPNNTARWVKAVFVKKYSHNVFQIWIGNVVAMAHRTQIRVCKQSTPLPSVWITRTQPRWLSHPTKIRWRLLDTIRQRATGCYPPAMIRQLARKIRSQLQEDATREDAWNQVAIKGSFGDPNVRGRLIVVMNFITRKC